MATPFLDGGIIIGQSNALGVGSASPLPAGTPSPGRLFVRQTEAFNFATDGVCAFDTICRGGGGRIVQKTAFGGTSSSQWSQGYVQTVVNDCNHNRVLPRWGVIAQGEANAVTGAYNNFESDWNTILDIFEQRFPSITKWYWLLLSISDPSHADEALVNAAIANIAVTRGNVTTIATGLFSKLDVVHYDRAGYGDDYNDPGSIAEAVHNALVLDGY